MKPLPKTLFSPSIESRLQKITADGWEIFYNPDTHFIEGKHPKGGRISIAEFVWNPLFDKHEMGQAVAAMLTKP